MEEQKKKQRARKEDKRLMKAVRASDGNKMKSNQKLELQRMRRRLREVSQKTTQVSFLPKLQIYLIFAQAKVKSHTKAERKAKRAEAMIERDKARKERRDECLQALRI